MGTGGSGTGGAATGGAATGGAATGGTSTGGKGTGGVSNTGGAPNTGGTATGGSATGGSATGGSPTAGNGGKGGATTGGSGPGGHAGGSATGGTGQSGGAGGQPGSGGNGGSSGYQPCPTDGSPCLILPFGDSITYGVGSSDMGAYRSPLFKLIVQANQNATFVGSVSSGPAMVAGKTFPKNNEGHSGWTIDPGYVSYGDGISKLIPNPAFNKVPHIVLLMIGTNDVNASMGLDTIADRLDKLLDKIVQAAPNALVVVAIPTPLGYGSSALTNYSAKIPGVVKAHVTKGQHMVSVDMSKMPTSQLNSDNIHPNDQGYSYMANIWYAAIKDVLH
jgi:lysophospholipase L1-like esterase